MVSGDHNSFDDQQAKLEVWTNAVNLDSKEGNWKAVPFKLLSNVQDVPKKWEAKMTVPVSCASFEYTYRIISDEGAITWLGGLGSNGVVAMGEGAQEKKPSVVSELMSSLSVCQDFTQDGWKVVKWKVDDEDV